MRKIIFGSYDTWVDWGLTLTSLELSTPEYKSCFVSVPGRDGDLDLSTALSDGEPRYNNRELTATFELSTGTRESRLSIFSAILNALDGRRVNIILPDDAMHYIVGRVRVVIDYCGPAHGALTITGNCEPWRYATTDKSCTLTATRTGKNATLINEGRRILAPTIVVSGASASVELTSGERNWTLAAGTYILPDLQLRPGNNVITYRGTGTMVVSWREAIL